MHWADATLITLLIIIIITILAVFFVVTGWYGFLACVVFAILVCVVKFFGDRYV